MLNKISTAFAAVSFCVLVPNVFAKTVADFDFPVQEFRIGISNTDRSVTATDAESGNYLKSETFIGNGSQKWFLNYVSEGVFEIANSQTGLLVTNDRGLAVQAEAIADSAKSENQKWLFRGVEKDFDGYDFYYKIVSRADTNQALTFNVNNNSLSVAPYSKNEYQKFKINLNGLEGFAANAKVDEGEKAGLIGGLFGRTVVVSTVADFKKAIGSIEPMTVVVNGTLDMQKESHTRIRDNKTIIGAYKANTLQDCFLRTNNEYGNEGDEPSDNIVIRNIDFEAVNVEDRILVNIWSSRNIWFDHCTFNSKLNRAEDEVGKFIWINTPYMDYLDKKDNGRSPDYITISYCTFTNRFWTVAYGTQNSETRRDRTTLMYNTWDKNVRRCPQLGNGIAHIYNNLYIGSDSGNDKSTDQIISGEGSEIVSEFCRFQSVTGKEIVGDNDPYRDNGSMTSKTSSATPTALNYTPKTKSNWNPNKTNYGYTLLQAYNTKGTDTKDFNLAYAGAFDAYSKIKYVGDEDLKKFVNTVYPSPFLKSIEVGSEPVEFPKDDEENGSDDPLRLNEVASKSRTVSLNNHLLSYEAPIGSKIQVFSVNGHLLHQEISTGRGTIRLKQNQKVILRWR